MKVKTCSKHSKKYVFLAKYHPIVVTIKITHYLGPLGSSLRHFKFNLCEGYGHGSLLPVLFLVGLLKTMAKEEDEDKLPDQDAAKEFYAKYEPKEILGRSV